MRDPTFLLCERQVQANTDPHSASGSNGFKHLYQRRRPRLSPPWHVFSPQLTRVHAQRNQMQIIHSKSGQRRCAAARDKARASRRLWAVGKQREVFALIGNYLHATRGKRVTLRFPPLNPVNMPRGRRTGCPPHPYRLCGTRLCDCVNTFQVGVTERIPQ